MLTINTSVIKPGSFREKLWNILNKIYNPYRFDFVDRINQQHKDIRENNEYIVRVVLPSNENSGYKVLLGGNYPKVVTKEVDRKYGPKIDYYFEDVVSSGTVMPSDDENKKLFPLIVDGNHYVYSSCQTRAGMADCGYVIYLNEKHGWVDVTDNVKSIRKRIESEEAGNYKTYAANVVVDEEQKILADKLYRKCQFYSNIGHAIYRVMHTIDSVVLCLRFPFLYPRNRFTGKHYNNWVILDYIKERRNKSAIFANIKNYINGQRLLFVDGKYPEVKKEECERNKSKYLYYTNIEHDTYTDKCVLYDESINTYVLHIGKDEKGVEHNYIYSPVFGWVIVDNYLDKKNGEIDFDHTDEENGYVTMCRNIVINRPKYIWSEIVQWFHDYVLAFIFCIPTSNELDAMERGWMSKFGIDICKDIRKCLLKNGSLKMLFSYRIMQIKEKFGGLRWYDSGAPREVYEIISKYENISDHTCIVCGKPARYITSGWICPYCEEHISEQSKATAIEIDENGHRIKKESEEEIVCVGHNEHFSEDD